MCSQRHHKPRKHLLKHPGILLRRLHHLRPNSGRLLLMRKDLLCPMPEGCIIGLSTAVFIVQNISRNKSLSSCTLYWSSVRPWCVMILVSVFLWSWLRPARLTKINASKLSPNGNASLCCCRLFSLSCLNATKEWSSVQGTLTWGSVPGVAAATCAPQLDLLHDLVVVVEHTGLLLG